MQFPFSLVQPPFHLVQLHFAFGSSPSVALQFSFFSSILLPSISLPPDVAFLPSGIASSLSLPALLGRCSICSTYTLSVHLSTDSRCYGGNRELSCPEELFLGLFLKRSDTHYGTTGIGSFPCRATRADAFVAEFATANVSSTGLRIILIP